MMQPLPKPWLRRAYVSSAVIGMFANHRLLLPHIWIKLVDEDLGLTIQVGRIYTPTVNVTPPGALAATYDRYGAFPYSWDGAKLSKSFGRVIVHVGLGRAEQFSRQSVPPRSLVFTSYDP